MQPPKKKPKQRRTSDTETDSRTQDLEAVDANTEAQNKNVES